jgi:hypothetical protein
MAHAIGTDSFPTLDVQQTLHSVMHHCGVSQRDYTAWLKQNKLAVPAPVVLREAYVAALEGMPQSVRRRSVLMVGDCRGSVMMPRSVGLGAVSAAMGAVSALAGGAALRFQQRPRMMPPATPPSPSRRSMAGGAGGVAGAAGAVGAAGAAGAGAAAASGAALPIVVM